MISRTTTLRFALSYILLFAFVAFGATALALAWLDHTLTSGALATSSPLTAPSQRSPPDRTP